jgi:hypothetical protein
MMSAAAHLLSVVICWSVVWSTWLLLSSLSLSNEFKAMPASGGEAALLPDQLGKALLKLSRRKKDGGSIRLRTLSNMLIG